MDGYSFTVRSWSVNAAFARRDEPYASFIPAVLRAWEIAKDRSWRTAMVIDDRAMVWAQFNMLWSLPDACHESTLTSAIAALGKS